VVFRSVGQEKEKLITTRKLGAVAVREEGGKAKKSIQLALMHGKTLTGEKETKPKSETTLPSLRNAAQ